VFERNVGFVEGRSVGMVLYSGLGSVGPTLRQITGSSNTGAGHLLPVVCKHILSVFSRFLLDDDLLVVGDALLDVFAVVAPECNADILLGGGAEP
jgi:hypothetical protein